MNMHKTIKGEASSQDEKYLYSDPRRLYCHVMWTSGMSASIQTRPHDSVWWDDKATVEQKLQSWVWMLWISKTCCSCRNNPCKTNTSWKPVCVCVLGAVFSYRSRRERAEESSSVSSPQTDTRCGLVDMRMLGSSVHLGLCWRSMSSSADWAVLDFEDFCINVM